MQRSLHSTQVTCLNKLQAHELQAPPGHTNYRRVGCRHTGVARRRRRTADTLLQHTVWHLQGDDRVHALAGFGQHRVDRLGLGKEGNGEWGSSGAVRCGPALGDCTVVFSRAYLQRIGSCRTCFVHTTHGGMRGVGRHFCMLYVSRGGQFTSGCHHPRSGGPRTDLGLGARETVEDEAGLAVVLLRHRHTRVSVPLNRI